MLIAETYRLAFDEVEQPVAARFDVGAVLDVVRRPEFLGRGGPL